MQQDKNNIKNIFSAIENEAEANLSQIDNHWAQMKNTLGVQNPKKVMPKKWLWVSLPILAVIIGLLFFANRSLKNNDTANVNNSNEHQAKQQRMDSTSFQKNMDTSSKKITNFEFKNKSNNSKTSFTNKVSNKIINSRNNYKSDIQNNVKMNVDKNLQNSLSADIFSNSNTDSVIVNSNLEQSKNIEILNNFISKIQKKGEFFTI